MMGLHWCLTEDLSSGFNGFGKRHFASSPCQYRQAFPAIHQWIRVFRIFTMETAWKENTRLGGKIIYTESNSNDPLSWWIARCDWIIAKWESRPLNFPLRFNHTCSMGEEGERKGHGSLFCCTFFRIIGIYGQYVSLFLVVGVIFFQANHWSKSIYTIIPP